MSSSGLQEVISYFWNIDSDERTNGTNENPTFNTVQPLVPLAKNGVFLIYFTSVQIPFTFYQLSNFVTTAQTYVTIPISMYDGTTTKTGLSLNIQQGNYTAYTLITTFQTALNAIWALNSLAGTPVFNSTYNTSTGFITYSMSAAGVAAGSYVKLNFASLSSSYTYIAGYFGFDPVTPISITISTTTSASSTQPCVLNPINYLLIRSTLRQQRSREFITAPDLVSTILHKVPITTQQSSYINYFQTTEPIFLIDNIISAITFSLTTNLNSNTISLQNIPWSCSFIIKEVVRPDYVSINSTKVLNQLKPMDMMSDEEKQRLLDERDKQLQRLSFYKDKLDPSRQPSPSSEKIEAPAPQEAHQDTPKEAPKEPEVSAKPVKLKPWWNSSRGAQSGSQPSSS